IALGGSLDVIPHTVPPKISGVVNLSSETDELKERAIELTSYQGPSSIYSLLMVEAARQNIPMVSLWVHTPHYLQVTNFMGCYHLMLKLGELLGLNIDLDVAKKDSEYLFQQIDLAIKQKPELQEYVKTLESEFHKGSKPRENPINKNIIKEIEGLFKDNTA
ncbi:MAG TPA: PAC2 family protein, partial [Dehalococcoidales bacterium]|nr:PAC2 family protein [Dehalococcoidales bacterium]